MTHQQRSVVIAKRFPFSMVGTTLLDGAPEDDDDDDDEEQEEDDW